MNNPTLYARLSQSINSFCHLQWSRLNEIVQSCTRFFYLDELSIILLKTLGTFQLMLLWLLSLVILESECYLISHIKGCVSAFCHIISILSLRVIIWMMSCIMINFPILISCIFASLQKWHSFNTCSRKCTRRSRLAESWTDAFEVQICTLVVYFIVWIEVLQLILRWILHSTCSICIVWRLINKYSELTPSRQRFYRIILDLVHKSAHFQVVFPLFLLFHEFVNIAIENILFVIC